jgi:TolB-like protein
MTKGILVLMGACLCLTGACGVPRTPQPSSETRPAARELDRQIDLLAEQIIGSLSAQDLGPVALVAFTDLDGKPSGLGTYLAEELTLRLFRTGRFRLVERKQMDKLLAEQKFQASGLIDEASAARLGRLAGAGALLTGTIADLDASVKLNARLINTESGTLFAVASVRVPVDPELAVLLGRRPQDGAGAASGHFDGAWEAVISCAAQAGGMAYTVHCPATVRAGVFHGQFGTEGVAPCLSIDGRIAADGTAVLMASGLTGSPRYSMNHARSGFPFFYHIQTTFTETGGTGRRLEDRPCEVVFFKR